METAARPPLDEVMLAMDVVDTLRHRERVVERELSADERDQELIVRLREIYAGQGIEVSDDIIAQGVRDLRADRFVYSPPPPSLGRTLARIYVSRRHWSAPVGFAAALLAAIVIVYQVFVRGPELEAIAALPGELEQAYAAVVDLAESPEVDSQALAIRSVGERAIESEDHDVALEAIGELESLHAALDLSYEIRVRSAPGELSGVWRIPEDNPNAQNFYLVVEAIGAGGDVLRLPMTNEETGQTARVTRWAQRVDQSMFDAIAADKQDDGIIQSGTIGRKRRGVLEREFLAGVRDGAITDW